MSPTMTPTRPSFLETVLTNAGQVEMTNLKERCEEVAQNVSELKVRVNDYMKRKFIDFDPLLKKKKEYLDKAVRTSDEINTLFNRIELQTKCDLANSTGELRNLHASLKESSLLLTVTTELLQIEDVMKEVEDACKNGQFVDAAKSLQSFRELTKNCTLETQQLDIYKSMLREFDTLCAKFYIENTKKLCSFISWESIELSDYVVRSIIKIKSNCVSELQEVAQALYLFGMLPQWMAKLKNFFMRSFLLPLINNETIVEFVEENEVYSALQIIVKIKCKPHSYSITLDNLTKCFEFLHGELDMQFEDGKSFLGLLGHEISEEFTDALIKNCLKETIPSSSAEHANFSGIRERVAKFNNYMVAIDFLSEENHSLSDYVTNFDALCANRGCENYLKRARDIMREDLQDMVEVGPQTPTASLSSTLDNTCGDHRLQDSSVNFTIKPENEMSRNLFQFPTCYVSKSTLEILNLVNTILGEITRNPNDSGLHRIYLKTARSVFEIYMAVVPTIHKKLLETIPQQAALFHNNCMYLAHRLVLLGCEVEASLRSVVEEGIPITFVDFVLPLRHLGAVTYIKLMQQQRKQILDLIKDSGLATLGENAELSVDTERTLRQCLRQLELLQSVCQNVLPRDIYSKSIGAMANSFLEELVVRVCTVEDIPANTAVQLTSHFKMISERIPKLFEEESKVALYIKLWQQFQELITVLNANLRDIEERWADGKGPLADQFTAEQMKQLVRALFQNTKRRAEVLSKLK